jgi:uncharacterized membrane protein YkgB
MIELYIDLNSIFIIINWLELVKVVKYEYQGYYRLRRQRLT